MPNFLAFTSFGNVDDFEAEGGAGGTLTRWTATSATASGTISADTTSALAGTYGLHANKTATADSGTAYVRQTITPPASNVVSMQWKHKTVSKTVSGGTLRVGTLYRVATVGNPVCDIIYTTAYQLRVRGRNGSYVSTPLTTQLVDGTAYTLELVYDASGAQPIGKLYINGTLDTSYTDATAGTIYIPDEVRLGVMEEGFQAKGEVNYDNAKVADGFIGTGQITVSPSTVKAGSTGNSLALVGSGGAAWTAGTPGTPTFTASAGTITAQTVTDPTHATLTYTAPAAPGAVTITDPSTGGTAVVTVVGIPVNDAAFGLSPANWFIPIDNSYAETNCPGYGAFQVTNTTTLSLVLNTTGLTGTMPTIRYMVSNGTGEGLWQEFQLSGTDLPATPHQIASGLTLGTTYRVFWYVKKIDDASDKWNTPLTFVTLLGVNGDSGATFSAYPYWYTDKAVAFGDSITEGINAADKKLEATPPQVSGSTGGSGNTVQAGTWYAVATYATTYGESIAGFASPGLIVTSGQNLVVGSPPTPAPAGATGWYCYIGSASTGPFYRQGGLQTLGVNATYTTALATSGTQPPTLSTAYLAEADPFHTYVMRLREALKCEIGVIAFNGQGWTVAPGIGSHAPAFTSAWNLHWSGQSRTFPTLKYWFVNHGFNDGAVADATLTTAINSWLTSVAGTAGINAAKGFVIVPFAGVKRAAITAANVSTSASPYLIDLGAAFQNGYAGVSSRRSPTDGTHPGFEGHAEVGGALAQAIQQKLGGTGVGGVPRRFQ